MNNNEEIKKQNGESGIFFGKNSVFELLQSGAEIDKLFVRANPADKMLAAILSAAAEKRIPVIRADTKKLDGMSGSANHQGVAAAVSEIKYSGLGDILSAAEQKGQAPLVVICDSVTDPHNLGAIIRSAHCAGAHGVVIGKRRSAAVNQTVAKASAGAVFHIPVVKTANIASAVEFFKKNNVWVWALDAGGESMYAHDYTGGCAFIVGSEGSGISRIVGGSADFTVSVPMYGKIDSLNVSNAAAVVLFEAARQRNIIPIKNL